MAARKLWYSDSALATAKPSRNGILALGGADDVVLECITIGCLITVFDVVSLCVGGPGALLLKEEIKIGFALINPKELHMLVL